MHQKYKTGCGRGRKTVIQHKILKEKNYAYIEVRGKPPLTEFIGAARLFVNDPDYSAGLDRICDFSQANLSHITLDDLITFAQFAKTQIRLLPNTKCAIVAPDVQRSGIFKSFADQIKTGNFQSFTDPMAAVEWITEEVELTSFDRILSGVA